MILIISFGRPAPNPAPGQDDDHQEHGNNNPQLFFLHELYPWQAA